METIDHDADDLAGRSDCLLMDALRASLEKKSGKMVKKCESIVEGYLR